MQADTIVPELGNPLAFDRYAYVKNNPIINIDPYGHNGIEFCPGKNDGYAIIAIGSIWSLFISIAQRDGLSEKIEDAITNFPIRLPEIQPLTFPPPFDQGEGSMAGIPMDWDSGYNGVYVFPLEMDGQRTLILDFPIDIKIPQIFLKFKTLETEYGDHVRARKLSNREVRKLDLHEEKQAQGFRGRDDIYIDEDGNTWIRRGKGPLIEFP